jgi:hypothetical protein
MNLEAERKLKFDRRLHRRSGWISKQELESELSDLPDAADKIYVPEEEPEAPAAAAAEPAPAPAPAAGTLPGDPPPQGGSF